MDFGVAIAMGKTKVPQNRRRWLALSLITNLGLLFSFKYANFAESVLRDLLGVADIQVATPYLDALLLVGISFYTFQTLSYTIGVYKGKQIPIRYLGQFALYVSFSINWSLALLNTHKICCHNQLRKMTSITTESFRDYVRSCGGCSRKSLLSIVLRLL